MAGQGCGASSQAESRGQHRTESQAWPRRSYHRLWGLGAELGGAMGSIQLDTLVLRQPTSEVSSELLFHWHLMTLLY